MLDIKFIRENSNDVQLNALNKGYKVDIAALEVLDDNRRRLQVEADVLRQKRNANVAQTKGARPTDELIAEGKAIKDQLAVIEPQLKQVESDFTDLLKKVPNMALADVPVGLTEDDNAVAKAVGGLPNFNFKPLNHADIAAKHGWLDKERAAKSCR